MHSFRLRVFFYYPRHFKDKINILSVLIFSFIITTSFLVNIVSAQTMETIIIVSSYSPNDLCGSPQLKGILNALLLRLQNTRHLSLIML